MRIIYQRKPQDRGVFLCSRVSTFEDHLIETQARLPTMAPEKLDLQRSSLQGSSSGVCINTYFSHVFGSEASQKTTNAMFTTKYLITLLKTIE